MSCAPWATSIQLKGSSRSGPIRVASGRVPPRWSLAAPGRSTAPLCPARARYNAGARAASRRPGNARLRGGPGAALDLLEDAFPSSAPGPPCGSPSGGRRDAAPTVSPTAAPLPSGHLRDLPVRRGHVPVGRAPHLQGSISCSMVHLPVTTWPPSVTRDVYA